MPFDHFLLPLNESVTNLDVPTARLTRCKIEDGLTRSSGAIVPTRKP
jgi:hypothetical protein